MSAAVAAVILVATAAIALSAALYLFLVSLSAAPPLAALLVGLTALATAGLTLCFAWLAVRCRGSARTSGGAGVAMPDRTGNLNDLAAQLGALAAQELTSRARAHPYRVFVGALLAGLAVGGIPEL